MQGTHQNIDCVEALRPSVDLQCPQQTVGNWPMCQREQAGPSHRKCSATRQSVVSAQDESLHDHGQSFRRRHILAQWPLCGPVSASQSPSSRESSRSVMTNKQIVGPTLDRLPHPWCPSYCLLDRKKALSALGIIWVQGKQQASQQIHLPLLIYKPRGGTPKA